MNKIIIIDDQRMLRDMISDTLGADGSIEVCAVSSSAKDAPELCEKYSPDLILMDICTEDNASGLEYSRIIKEKFPEIKIIIMTGMPDLNFINDAKKYGVDSFIYKNVSKDALISAVKSTLEGYNVYPNETNAPSSDVLEKLTKTELKVLTVYCKTLDREETAEILEISPRTLKAHIASIYEKTGFKNLAKLCVYCVSNGLIVPNLEGEDSAN